MSKQSSEDKLIAGLQVLSLLTYVPEYMGNTYSTMRLILSGARANNIEGSEDLESFIGEI